MLHKKTLLAVRIIGCCGIMLAVWGSWHGSFSPVAFILILVIGIATGCAFHNWAEHVRKKCKNEPLTEKEKQKFLKWLSMGKWKFVFIHGFLLWVIFAILISVTLIWKNRDDLTSLGRFLSFGTVIVFVMIAILGITQGLIMWVGIQKTAQEQSLLKNSSDDIQ